MVPSDPGGIHVYAFIYIYVDIKKVRKDLFGDYTVVDLIHSEVATTPSLRLAEQRIRQNIHGMLARAGWYYG